MPTQNHRLKKSIILASSLAAVLYCSWMIGYIVNPTVSLQGTASELAASDQPFRMLFVLSDVATAALLVATALCLLMISTKQLHRLISAMYGAFGVAVLLTAVFSLECVIAEGACDSSRYAQRYAIHMTIGTCGLVLLFIGNLLANNTAPRRAITHAMSWIVWGGGLLGIASFLLSLLVFEPLVVAFTQRIFLLSASYAIWLTPHLLLKAVEQTRTPE